MSILCKISLHKYKGCKCLKCGYTRDVLHDWSLDCKKCSICGKSRKRSHDWTEDCEECAYCYVKRPNQHDWSKDCTSCSNCKTTRDIEHDWQGCKCSNCSQTRNEQHNWEKFLSRCSVCNKLLKDELQNCNAKEKRMHFERVIQKIEVFEKSDIYPDSMRIILDDIIDIAVNEFESYFGTSINPIGQTEIEFGFKRCNIEFRRSYSTSFGYNSIQASYIYRVESDKYILVRYDNNSLS